MSQNLRIVLIEDDDILRMGYESLLSDVEDFVVVNAYASYDLAKKYLEADHPDVILLDIQMPGTNGLQALPFIKKALPNANIIILTVFDSPELVFEALTMGAGGYLTKNSSASKIIDAVREVSTGGGAMSTNVARIVMHSFQKNLNSPLTKRETEILDRIANGQTKSQIANDLFIDQETVRSHVKNIYIKLDVNSKSEAIKTAKEKRFI
ncbi:Transcriptional regulatory protein DegU [Pedobacter sp. Bi27]|jgi:DNA-binding NarL/FixJ family response regulator|uniref:response regulator transcription factor n=1 Tax=unclassified Pedobacter TaxID=2628915 RepID=UPI001BECE177|nr:MULTISPECIES: response regulator transcription factor [unclassified Pedobacter]MBT2562399.1 response regulator transcription factor [Pedobacter sp. ISL-64]CAH0183931.1 Transcriptional regulatory protein DegU [Pedobacter sp. Bi36]CAH0208171.1 Transcriptional regulatory protein DegU [Pedobacter sp. Bi27]CAH0239713.1 Transcriptional regulatory protein DegU [Pedobacter sp. Bi126]